MPFDVFISYSVKDKATADAVCARMEAEKVRCWIAPRDVPPGMDWDESIIAGIKSCRVMVLILSSHSNASPEVKREVKLAFKKGLTVMPFRIEEVSIGEGLEYYMSSVHWLDALTPPMERHIEKLAALVGAFITATNQTETAPAEPTKAIHAPSFEEPLPVKPQRQTEPETLAFSPPPGPTLESAAPSVSKKPERKTLHGLIKLMLALLIIAVIAAAFYWMPKSGTTEPHIQQGQEAAPTKQPSTITTYAPKENPFVNSLGMKFVPVPITGGPTDGQKVLFSIWDTQVQDYRAYAETNSGIDASWKSPGFEQDEDHPVVKVNWEDAKAFCAWLTQKERSDGKIGANDEYRLPTDHEWSCAVGIGDQEDASATPLSKNEKIEGMYPWGKQWPPPVGAGNYDPSLKVDDFEYTSPVGSFGCNQNGLYDLGGNVWQWCEDWYDGEQKARVIRGASWDCLVSGPLLSSCRGYVTPDLRIDSNGFRCVLASGSSPR